MALIKCHECGTEVSTEAKTCPKCGAKVKKPMGAGTILLIGLVTIVVLSAMVSGGGTPSASQPSARDVALTPFLSPSLDVRPLDPKAKARAEKITTDKFCKALGKALRGKDEEFTRAMIQRTAELQLGVLHFNEQNNIKSKHINLGMTPCMAIAAWGRPEDVNRSVGSFGVHEQWVYPANYLYFEDGVLTSFQD